MPDTDLTLEEFPPNSYAEWKEAAEASLKGAPFEKVLRTRTHEGITLEPIYTSPDPAEGEAWPGISPYLRGSHAAPSTPLVAQEIPFGVPADFNRAVLGDLMRGQDALAIQLDVASRAGVDPSEADTSEVCLCGLSLACLADVRAAFDEVEPSAITTLMWAGASALPMAGLLQAHSGDWQGGILADPLTEYARDGKLPLALDDAYTEMAELLNWAASREARLRTIGVGANLWADSGGTAVEELAFAMATGTEYLRELEKLGIEPDRTVPSFVFTFSLGANLFMEIAKLRAARALWSFIQKSCGIEPVPAWIHGRSGIFNKSTLDPYTNMLRATTEAFVGVIGGVDSFHVACFDETVRLPGEFSRRIARNVHTILNEECEFGAVTDASGGSWFVESLTSELIAKAWALFQVVEEKGGMLAALRKGFPQQAVEKSAESRLKMVAQRRDGLVGVNLFPNPQEEPLEPDQIDHQLEHARRAEFIESQRPHSLPKIERSVEGVAKAFLAGATLGQVTDSLPRSAPCEPEIERVRVRRAAEGYERLRDQSRRFARANGHPPKVWLANFGPPKQHKARADFCAGFFAAGGFEIASGAGAASPEEAAAAAVGSKAPVVVICSTDPTYPEIVPGFLRALKSAGSRSTILLAGYPTDHVEQLKEAGVDDFVHIKLNCLDFLSDLQRQLGVSL